MIITLYDPLNAFEIDMCLSTVWKQLLKWQGVLHLFIFVMFSDISFYNFCTYTLYVIRIEIIRNPVCTKIRVLRNKI